MLLPQNKPKRIIQAFADKIPPGDVLDLGCNTGRNALFLAKNHAVDAVDVDSDALRILKQSIGNSPIRIHHGSIVDFSFTQPYAGIICTDVLHFLQLSDSLGLIKHMKKHTAQGGINIITSFLKEGELKGIPTPFYPDELQKYYSDWEILHYEEKTVDCHAKKPDGTPFKHESAILVAKKK